MTFNKPVLDGTNSTGRALMEGLFSNSTDSTVLNMKTDEILDNKETSILNNILSNDNLDTDLDDQKEVGEDNEEELDSKDSKDSKNSEDSDANQDLEEESEYEIAARELYEKGLIKGLPEGMTEIPDLKTYNKVLEYNKQFVEKDIIANIEKDLDERLSPIARQILYYELNKEEGGGDTEGFMKSLLYITDTNSLDVEDPKDQEEIIYQYLISKMDEKETLDIIETLKENPDKLKAKAVEYKPKLVDVAVKEAEKIRQEQEIIEKEETDKKDYLYKKLADQLQTGKLSKISDISDDIPLTKEDAQWLLDASLNGKIKQKVKGKVVDMEIMEAMSHFHKYHKEGDINLYMTALLLMKDPNKVMTHLMKIAKKEVVKDVRSDNTFSNTGLVFSKKKAETTTKQKEGKKLFSLTDLS